MKNTIMLVFNAVTGKYFLISGVFRHFSGKAR